MDRVNAACRVDAIHRVMGGGGAMDHVPGGDARYRVSYGISVPSSETYTWALLFSAASASNSRRRSSVGKRV